MTAALSPFRETISTYILICVFFFLNDGLVAIGFYVNPLHVMGAAFDNGLRTICSRDHRLGMLAVSAFFADYGLGITVRVFLVNDRLRITVSALLVNDSGILLGRRDAGDPHS